MTQEINETNVKQAMFETKTFCKAKDELDDFWNNAILIAERLGYPDDDEEALRKIERLMRVADPVWNEL